jgi:hypothetical protein
MKKQSEAKIQQEIFQWFNNEYCLQKHNPRLIIYSVPNGSSTGDPRVINMMSLLGMVKGVSDLKIEGVKGRVISVEVKNDIGKQSPHQIEMQQRTETNGGVYLLVRSLEDFKEQIKPHLLFLTEKEL